MREWILCDVCAWSWGQFSLIYVGTVPNQRTLSVNGYLWKTVLATGSGWDHTMPGLSSALFLPPVIPSWLSALVLLSHKVGRRMWAMLGIATSAYCCHCGMSQHFPEHSIQLLDFFLMSSQSFIYCLFPEAIGRHTTMFFFKCMNLMHWCLKYELTHSLCIKKHNAFFCIIKLTWCLVREGSFVYWFSFAALKVEPRSSRMLGKHFLTDPRPKPSDIFVCICVCMHEYVYVYMYVMCVEARGHQWLSFPKCH